MFSQAIKFSCLVLPSAKRLCGGLLIFFTLLPFFSQAAAAPLPAETRQDKTPDIVFTKGLLSVRTSGVTIDQLMEEVGKKAGIGVSVSPKLKNKKVSVQFADLPLEKGLIAIQQSAGVADYALVYRQSKEPGKIGEYVVDDIYLLKEGKDLPINVPSVSKVSDSNDSVDKAQNNKPQEGKSKGKTALEKEPFFDKKLNRFVEVVKGEAMIRLAKGLAVEKAGEIFKDLGATVIKKNGTLNLYRLKIPQGLTVAEFIDQHEKDKSLQFVEPNFITTALTAPALPPNDPSLSSQWAISTIQADKAWEITTGSPNVVVAVLDTGIESTHQDLKNKIVPGIDIVNMDNDPSDDNGHGTHVSGIIAADANNNLGIAGISWGSMLMPVKVITASGEGAYSDLTEGIIYAADHGARVLNLSVGGYSYSQTLGDAVEYAHGKGAVLVAAGGNEGSSEPIYPAAYPNVIGVAATDPADQIWTSSNHGSAIKIAAPGASILSATLNNAYVRASGTSASAAYVSGVAALILSKNPDFSNTQIEQILYRTADDLGDKGPDQIYGNGRVNAAKALAVASIEVHDVAVTRIRIEPLEFKVGEPAQIIVTVQNQGTFLEKNLSVSALVNDVPVESVKKIETIKPGEFVDVSFIWAPSIAEGIAASFKIKGEVGLVEGETDTTDNVGIDEFVGRPVNGSIVIKHQSEPHMQAHQYLVGEAARIWPGGYVTDSNHHEIWDYIGEKVNYDLNDAAICCDTNVTTYGGRFNGQVVKSPFDPRALPCTDPRHISTNPLGCIGHVDNDYAVPYSEFNLQKFSTGTGTNDIAKCGDQGPDNLTAGSCTDPGDDILEGVMEEDYFALFNPDNHPDTFYNDGLDLNGACIFTNHLWKRPDHKETLGTGLTIWSQCSAAPKTPYEIGKGYWDKSIIAYANGNKGLAYYYLGRVAHFLTDMSVPAHAHADNHGSHLVGGYDSYERYMGKNYTKYTFNSTSSGP